MGKRGNSEGTIRKRADGRWEARVILQNGARKSLYGKTRQEVVRLLDQVRRDREQGLGALTDRQTVGQYLEVWLQSEAYRVKHGSFCRYGQAVRLHLIPGLGQVVLSKLTAQQVSAFYAGELERGQSPNEVRYSHSILHAALEDALKLGVVHRNVVHLVDPPRRVKREMAVYTEAQARHLLNVIAGDRLEALCVLVLATGMREGELLSLRWGDVDLERNMLTVWATLQRRTRQGLVREQAKTGHSRRTIALSEAVVGALRHHRERQVRERLQLGDVWAESNLVFPNTIGRPMDATNLRRYWWYPLLKRAGLPRIRFHDMRHTAATLLLSRGVNVKVVSEMLGHASVSVTLSLYAHVLPHMQQHAVETMETIIRGEVRDLGALGSEPGSTGA